MRTAVSCVNERSIARRVCAWFFASLFIPLSIARAQSGAIVGSVVDQNGRPVVGAQVSVLPGERSVVTEANGAFAIPNLAPATYTLTARRIGYEPAASRLAVRDSIVHVSIRLTAIATQLDSVRVREKKSGFTYGAIVLDLNNQPVIGAEVVAIGVTNKLVTDSLGRFTVPKLSQGTLAVRLRKMGYRATLVSMRMLGDRTDTLRMPRLAQSLSAVEIKERSGFGNDEPAYEELDKRTRWKGAAAATVSREELDALGNANLCDALASTATAGRIGLHPYQFCSTILRKTLINGVSCEVHPLSDFRASDVEMVEIFMPPVSNMVLFGTSDLSGTLAAHQCDPNPGNSAPAPTARASGSRSRAVEQPAAGRNRAPDPTLTATLVIWIRKRTVVAVVPRPRTVAGIVFDSIAHLPLAGAHVLIEDLDREATTDSLGAFRFDSVPSGIHQFRANHQTLEDLGLLPLRDTLNLAPELLTQVTLAIPSFATLWNRVCSDSTPPREGQGLVYGRVLLGPARVSSTDTSGTIVEAAWRGVTADTSEDKRKQVPVDTAGNYAVCGAPTQQQLTLSSLSHGTATVSVSFKIGDPRIARRDLMLPASDILDQLSADSSSAPLLPAGEGSTVTGIARDSLGKPVSEARVTVSGVAGEWRTTASGAFGIRGIPGGARVVTTTQPGFLPERRLLDLAGTDSVAIELSMIRVATFLDTLKVSGKQSARTAALLDIASRRKLGLGYAKDSTALAMLPGGGLRGAFNVPSTRTLVTGPGLWYIVMTDHARSIDPTKGLDTRGCQPTIFVDGTPSNIQTVNDMTKEEIGLLEIFTSPSRAPSEFAGSGGNCGIVLIWRKRYLRP